MGLFHNVATGIEIYGVSGLGAIDSTNRLMNDVLSFQWVC